MEPTGASSEHSEVAAILMDVSQQDATVFSNQSQAATILMNVGQAKDVPSQSRTILMGVEDVKDKETATVIMAVDEGGQEVFSLGADMQIIKSEETYSVPEPSSSAAVSAESHQRFKVMSSDGEYHTITLAGIEEKIGESGEVQTSSIIQVDTPGRETETITVSGLADNYNLESLAQIAEIVVNSTDRTSSVVNVADDASIAQVEIDETAYHEMESQYIAMKETTVGGQMEENVSGNVVQTIAVDTPQGSQNLVSLAQVAELVINQGCLEVRDGRSPAMHELQITSDSNNQPVVISRIDSDISDMQSRKLSVLTNPSKAKPPKYISVPHRKTSTMQTKYITVPMSSHQKADVSSTYTTTILPDSRRNPPQRSSQGKNIYSKIKAENGECYMVVLPESDPLNPAQLQKLLSSYNSMTQVVEEDSIDTVGLKLKVKPEMYSTGSQTKAGRRAVLDKPAFTGTRHDQIPGTSLVIVRPDIPNRIEVIQTESDNLSSDTDVTSGFVNQGTNTDTNLAKKTPSDEGCMDIIEDSELVPVKVKKENEDVDDSENASQGIAKDPAEEEEVQSENLNNCGHEVAKKRSSDDLLPESRTISIQTDVTASCYLNVSPEELNIHKFAKPRMIYRNKRSYLDDPKPPKNPSEDYHVTVSPFLNRRNLLDTENAIYICGTCDAKFITAEELKVHSKDHKPKKAFCPTCKKKCGNLKILADHVISHTRCKTFKCCVCTSDTIFKSAEAFKEHVKEHLDDRYFLCGSCNQKFVHIANLKVHMRVHTGEKPFTCKQCHVGFSQKASLEAHVNSFHNKEKPFQCDQCGVNFARKTDLRIHSRKHTGERPYTCDLCDKDFSSNSGLTSHKKTHFRKRFHQCTDCDKSFDTPARLKRHTSNWHTGDKALKCRVCDKKFINRTEIQDHMRTHSQKPYPCFSCNYGTDCKEYLAAHIKDKHPQLMFKMPELFQDNEVFRIVKQELSKTFPGISSVDGNHGNNSEGNHSNQVVKGNSEDANAKVIEIQW